MRRVALFLVVGLITSLLTAWPGTNASLAAAVAPGPGSVVFNEFDSRNGPIATDFFELLVTESHLDLRGVRFSDNELKDGRLNTGESVLVLGQDAFLRDVAKGTVITVWTAPAGVRTDVDPADFQLVLAPGTGVTLSEDGLGGTPDAGLNGAGESLYLYLPGADGRSTGTDNVYLDYLSYLVGGGDAPAGLANVVVPGDAAYFTGGCSPTANDAVGAWTVHTAASGTVPSSPGRSNPAQDLASCRTAAAPIGAPTTASAVGPVVFNELNATNDGAGNDFFELLVIEDKADLRGLRVSDNELVNGVLNSGESVFRFGDDTFLTGIPRGTTIAVWTSSAGIVTDTKADNRSADWSMVLAPGTGLTAGNDGLGGTLDTGLSSSGDALYLYRPGPDGTSAGTDNVYLDYVSFLDDGASPPAGLQDVTIAAAAASYTGACQASGNDDLKRWTTASGDASSAASTPGRENAGQGLATPDEKGAVCRKVVAGAATPTAAPTTAVSPVSGTDLPDRVVRTPSSGTPLAMTPVDVFLYHRSDGSFVSLAEDEFTQDEIAAAGYLVPGVWQYTASKLPFKGSIPVYRWHYDYASAGAPDITGWFTSAIDPASPLFPAEGLNVAKVFSRRTLQFYAVSNGGKAPKGVTKDRAGLWSHTFRRDGSPGLGPWLTVGINHVRPEATEGWVFVGDAGFEGDRNLDAYEKRVPSRVQERERSPAVTNATAVFDALTTTSGSGGRVIPTGVSVSAGVVHQLVRDMGGVIEDSDVPHGIALTASGRIVGNLPTGQFFCNLLVWSAPLTLEGPPGTSFDWGWGCLDAPARSMQATGEVVMIGHDAGPDGAMPELVLPDDPTPTKVAIRFRDALGRSEEPHGSGGIAYNPKDDRFYLFVAAAPTVTPGTTSITLYRTASGRSLLDAIPPEFVKLGTIGGVSVGATGSSLIVDTAGKLSIISTFSDTDTIDGTLDTLGCAAQTLLDFSVRIAPPGGYYDVTTLQTIDPKKLGAGAVTTKWIGITEKACLNKRPAYRFGGGVGVLRSGTAVGLWSGRWDRGGSSAVDNLYNYALKLLS